MVSASDVHVAEIDRREGEAAVPDTRAVADGDGVGDGEARVIDDSADGADTDGVGATTEGVEEDSEPGAPGEFGEPREAATLTDGDGDTEALALPATYPVTIRLEEVFTIGPDGLAVRPEGHLVVAVNPGGAPPQGGVAIEALPSGVTLDALIGTVVEVALRAIPRQLAQAELDAVAVATFAPRKPAPAASRPAPTGANAGGGMARFNVATSAATTQTAPPPRRATKGPSMMERAVAMENARGGSAGGPVGQPADGATPAGPIEGSAPPSPVASPAAPAPATAAYTQTSLFDLGS